MLCRIYRRRAQFPCQGVPLVPGRPRFPAKKALFTPRVGWLLSAIYAENVTKLVCDNDSDVTGQGGSGGVSYISQSISRVSRLSGSLIIIMGTGGYIIYRYNGES